MLMNFTGRDPTQNLRQDGQDGYKQKFAEQFGKMNLSLATQIFRDPSSHSSSSLSSVPTIDELTAP